MCSSMFVVSHFSTAMYTKHTLSILTVSLSACTHYYTLGYLFSVCFTVLFWEICRFDTIFEGTYSLVEDSSESSLHLCGVVHIYHPDVGLSYGCSIRMLGCHLLLIWQKQLIDFPVRSNISLFHV